MPTKLAILLSGGMDSTTCLWWIRHHQSAEIHTISINYHQRHHIELQHAAHLSKLAAAHTHKVIDLDLSSSGGNPLTDTQLAVPSAAEKQQIRTVVPFRNMLFVTLAAAYAETQNIQDLYIAPVKDDYEAYRDCRRAFYDSLQQSLQLGATYDRPFNLHTPFVDKWKTEVVALGIDLNVPYAQTHTCYQGKRPACGQCDACAERIGAFKANKVADPLEYEIDISWPE